MDKMPIHMDNPLIFVTRKTAAYREFEVWPVSWHTLADFTVAQSN
jgi:hypothetical protein